MDVPVKVMAMLEENTTGIPVILLLDEKQNQILPIWIGHPEAQAIGIAYSEVETSRPLTHELFARTLDQLGMRIEKVRIPKVEDGTFFAELFVKNGQDSVIFDARPSDSIALALHHNAPLFVSAEVMMGSAHPNPFSQTDFSAAEVSPRDLDSLKRVLEAARNREYCE
jgi:uncharacterized protein